MLGWNYFLNPSALFGISFARSLKKKLVILTTLSPEMKTNMKQE